MLKLNRPVVSSALSRLSLKIGLDFVAGVAVGGAMGYGLDRLLGSKPIALCVFLMLGFGAGVSNVYKAVKMASKEEAKEIVDNGKST